MRVEGRHINQHVAEGEEQLPGLVGEEVAIAGRGRNSDGTVTFFGAGIGYLVLCQVGFQVAGHFGLFL